MIRIATVVGARPQFIKAAAVSRVIQKNRETIREILIHTGQHYDDSMNEVFFRELNIPEPSYQLGIGSAPHGRQTGRMLEGIEGVLQKENPDLVMVYGDTNSTLAGALAACKIHIPVAHVEAGLRSYNSRMPEEINRLLTDHAATFLFCPTSRAVENLVREGINGKSSIQRRYVVNTGDVMLDSLMYYRPLVEERKAILEELDLRSKGYVLATIHRAESTDDYEVFSRIFGVLKEVAKEQTVVFPVHPRTRKIIHEYSEDVGQGDLRLMEPAGYLDMMALISQARVIITDSGGVQKESFFLKVPCVTVRTETEWEETVESGWNLLAGTGMESILQCVRQAMEITGEPKGDYFGKGDAAEKIMSFLKKHL